MARGRAAGISRVPRRAFDFRFDASHFAGTGGDLPMPHAVVAFGWHVACMSKYVLTYDCFEPRIFPPDAGSQHATNRSTP